MKTSEFAAALVVVLLAATAIGGMLYYFKVAPPASGPVSQPTSNPRQTVQTTFSVTPTYSTEGFQETGRVTSVDSAGGHFSIANVGLGNPLWTTLSSDQLAQVQFGEDFHVVVVYAPLGQAVLDTAGKVVSVSSNGNCQPVAAGFYSQQPCATIALLNDDAGFIIPSAWNPQVGGQVVLTMTPETSSPLVVLTGVQLSAATCNSWSGSQCLNSNPAQQFSAFVNSPTCLQPAVSSSGGPCIFSAGNPISVNFTLSNYPFCPGCSYTISVAATDPGFTVSATRSGGGGILPGVTVELSVPASDYEGVLRLTFYFIPN